jgi:hypothetical protein
MIKRFKNVLFINNFRFTESIKISGMTKISEKFKGAGGKSTVLGKSLWGFGE